LETLASANFWLGINPSFAVSNQKRERERFLL
jgi:hypothetical protein